MIPGEYFLESTPIAANEKAKTIELEVRNLGDRPIQVGSHYHFFETNPQLEFDRKQARGMRLDIPAGTGARFEPGELRIVRLVELGGERRVFGHRGEVNGSL